MKKTISLILALLMLLSFSACTGKSEKETTTTEAAETSTISETAEVSETDEASTVVSTTGIIQTEPSTKPETTTEKTTKGTTAHIHKWDKATCVTPKTCRSCGATEGSTSDHSYTNATCETPAECTVCGQTSGSALGCTAGSDNNCIRCGKTLLTLSSVLSKPIDTLAEINTFVHGYFSQHCYTIGNFRLIFNSVDGVYLSWGATNISDKTIETITFTLNYYDVHGNPARDEINGNYSYTGQIIGPIEPGESFYMRKLIGYGAKIRYGVITDVTVEFSDGSTVSGNYGYKTWDNIRTTTDKANECFVIG